MHSGGPPLLLAYSRERGLDVDYVPGRWGVNYIYGTAAVLPALEALGVDMTQPRVRRAIDQADRQEGAGGGEGRRLG